MLLFQQLQKCFKKKNHYLSKGGNYLVLFGKCLYWYLFLPLHIHVYLPEVCLCIN